MTSQQFLDELKHLETIASTIVGLGSPADSPAKIARDKVRTLIDWLEGELSDDEDATPPTEDEKGEPEQGQGAPAEEPAKEEPAKGPKGEITSTVSVKS